MSTASAVSVRPHAVSKPNAQEIIIFGLPGDGEIIAYKGHSADRDHRASGY